MSLSYFYCIENYFLNFILFLCYLMRLSSSEYAVSDGRMFNE